MSFRKMPLILRAPILSGREVFFDGTLGEGLDNDVFFEGSTGKDIFLKGSIVNFVLSS